MRQSELPNPCPMNKFCQEIKAAADGSGRFIENPYTFTQDLKTAVVSDPQPVVACRDGNLKNCAMSFNWWERNLSHQLQVWLSTTHLQIGFAITGRGGENEPWRQFYKPITVENPSDASE